MQKNRIALIFALLSNYFLQSQSYFQQEVNYTIQVKLDDQQHTLSAFETIEYVNNSPDTLNFLYFHLWPNAYKNSKTALAKQLLESGDTKMQFAEEENLGFIDSLDFTSKEKKMKWAYDPKHIDICKLFLNEPLLPGQKTTISTPFFVKIPVATISRLGHIGQAYMITQWYPKPAVYDKEGWHPIPYLDQGEFFSEFGSYDVEISLPDNYVIQATGNLIEGDKEYAWMRNKTIETETKINQFKEGKFSPNMSFPESSLTLKTLKSTIENLFF